jgi:hypothetical protein
MLDFPSLVVNWLYGLPVEQRLFLAGGVVAGLASAFVVRRFLKQRWSTAILCGVLIFAVTLAFAPLQTEVIIHDAPP